MRFTPLITMTRGTVDRIEKVIQRWPDRPGFVLAVLYFSSGGVGILRGDLGWSGTLCGIRNHPQVSTGNEAVGKVGRGSAVESGGGSSTSEGMRGTKN
jgi:hypothetical protein